MVFYACLYLISLVLLCASLYMRKRKGNAIISYALAAASIVIPCIISALRDSSIGTDTDNYPLAAFNSAKNNGITHFLSQPLVGFEYLYYLIVYVCSRVFNSFPLLLFITQLLCVLPVFLVLDRESRKRGDIKIPIIGFLIFYLFSYNLSMNMMRQAVALSFCTLAFYNILDKKRAWAIAEIIVAFLFHSFALIMLPILLIYYICLKIRSKKVFAVFCSLFVCGLALSAIFLIPIVEFLGALFPKILSPVYLSEFTKIRNFSFAELLFWGTISAISIILILPRVKNTALRRFYLIILLISPFTAVLNYYVHFSGRILLYFQYIILYMFIPFGLQRVDDKKAFIRGSILYALPIIVYWYYYYICLNINETVPFLFAS